MSYEILFLWWLQDRSIARSNNRHLHISTIICHLSCAYEQPSPNYLYNFNLRCPKGRLICRVICATACIYIYIVFTICKLFGCSVETFGLFDWYARHTDVLARVTATAVLTNVYILTLTYIYYFTFKGRYIHMCFYIYIYISSHSQLAAASSASAAILFCYFLFHILE